MKLAAYNRLRKMMMLTTSENDAEALSSLRAANKILAEEGIDWNRVFDRTISVVAEFEAAPDESPVSKPPRDIEDDHRIENAFALVEETARGSFADFIGSLREQWDRAKFLSPKQRSALFDAAERGLSR